MSEAKGVFIRLTIKDQGVKYQLNFPWSSLEQVRLTDEEKTIIRSLYHTASAKQLFKNSERVIDGVAYGVEIF